MKNKELISNKIMRSVQKKLGDEYTVTLKHVLKNNGLTLTGLIITKNGEKISPTIYIDDFINYYEDASLEEITNMIVNTYYDAPTDFEISPFADFNWVKGKIIYQLINTACNEELLKDIPHIPFLDLSIVFRVLIDFDKNGGMASILIHNSHLKAWNVTKEAVYKIAEENTQRLLPIRVHNILNVIKEHCTELDLPFGNLDFEHDTCPMYVLSNPKVLYGSICVMYPNILSDFAKAADADIYVLPSSVHEVLLLPNYGERTAAPEELKGIVHEVNCTTVSRDEFLSDNIYYFSRKTQKLTQL